MNFLLNQSHSLLGKGDSHISMYKDNLECGVGDQHLMISCCFGVELLSQPCLQLALGPSKEDRGMGVPPQTRKCSVAQLELLFQVKQSQGELLMGDVGEHCALPQDFW